MVPAADGFRRSSRPLVISFSRLILPAGLMMAMDPGLPSIIIEALGRCAGDHIPSVDTHDPMRLAATVIDSSRAWGYRRTYVPGE